MFAFLPSARQGNLRRASSALFGALQILSTVYQVHADYFRADPKTSWQIPVLQPWEPLRATHTTITVAWTFAWNPWAEVAGYELQVRHPQGPYWKLTQVESPRFRAADSLTWYDDVTWTQWKTVYNGQGRVYTLRNGLVPGHPYEFRVRALGNDPNVEGSSDWSKPQITHTTLSAAVDEIPFFVRGTGKNNPDYTIIEVNHEIIYKRRDQTGLVLAAFSRQDFSLQWLRTYNTHHSREAALEMSRDLRLFNHSSFVVVVSTIAWEWRATASLARAMEFCGAYHFGQWAYIFAEQPHYPSPKSDLDQTASQQEFGHPYAFIGIPGIGAGMGWESLHYPTGHYLAEGGRAPKAIIRGIAYFDYVARHFRLKEMNVLKASLYAENAPPAPETIHRPMPAWKTPKPLHQVMQPPAYTPYVGSLQNHITRLIEANQTVPPRNYGFLLVTDARVHKVDPRPASYRVTELERIWGGASQRFWKYNSSVLFQGMPYDARNCSDFLHNRHFNASTANCGVNFKDCCSEIDRPGLPILSCGVGITPTLCKNSTVIEMKNTSTLLVDRRPFDFHVIDLEG